MQQLFVAYSRGDAKVVMPIVDAVRDELRARGLDVELWVDVARLAPGQSWQRAIETALSTSVGLLVFVSRAAMASRVNTEVAVVAAGPNRLIIPIVLERVPNLPNVLAVRQWVDLIGNRTKRHRRAAAKSIVDLVQAHLAGGNSWDAIAASDAKTIASEIVNDVRRTPRKKVDAAPQSIFIVHGHDVEALSELQAFVRGIGITPIVLSKVRGASQSLLQKFFASAAEARFAIVILSPDDLGASRLQYDEQGVADRALQFRARQNVLLELGFFYGLLGWENVFVVQRNPASVWPNFEKPSDLEGTVFDAMDSEGVWRETLAARLSEAGFRVTQS